MAATFEFDEANGAAETVTHGKTKADWKNEDSTTDNYGSFPVTAGNNSFEKWIYGHFSGTYNQLSAGLWAHTANALNGTSLIINPHLNSLRNESKVNRFGSLSRKKKTRDKLRDMY